MAEPDKEAYSQFKRRARRRLVGAVFLASLAIIFFPMILDRPNQSVPHEIEIQIPDTHDPHLPPLTATRPEVAPPVTTTLIPPVAPTPEPPLAKPAEVVPPKPTPQPVIDKPVAENTQYVVQLAALSDGQKAQELQMKLAISGIKSYTEVLKTPKGELTRVRAGPFLSHREADKTQEAMKKMGVVGVVVAK